MPGQLRQVLPQDVAGHNDLLGLLTTHPDVEDLEHELIQGDEIPKSSPLCGTRVVWKTRVDKARSQIRGQGLTDVLKILGI